MRRQLQEEMGQVPVWEDQDPPLSSLLQRKGDLLRWEKNVFSGKAEKKRAVSWRGTKEEKSMCMQNFPNPGGSECEVFLENANEVLAQGLATLPQRRKFKPRSALTDINMCTQTSVGSLCIYWIRQNEIASCPASSAQFQRKRVKYHNNMILLNLIFAVWLLTPIQHTKYGHWGMLHKPAAVAEHLEQCHQNLSDLIRSNKSICSKTSVNILWKSQSSSPPKPDLLFLYCA